MKTRVLAVAVLLAEFAVGQSQELKGAKHVLERMTEAPKVTGEAKADFEKRLAEFVEGSGHMSGAEAARAWTGLLAEALGFQQETTRYGYASRKYLEQVMASLPAPETWPHVSTAVRALGPEQISDDQKQALEFLVVLLLGDRGAQTTRIEAWLKEIDVEDPEALMSAAGVIGLYQEWAEFTRDKAHIKRSMMLSFGNGMLAGSSIPQTVMLLDPADREEVAKAFFANADYVYLDDEASEEYKTFFREMAVKYGQHNEELVWMSLAEVGAHKQFEAYCRENGKFTSLFMTGKLTKAEEDYLDESMSAGDALQSYVVSLMVAGESAKAERILVNNSQRFEEMMMYGFSPAAFETMEEIERIALSLSRVLTQKPSAKFWTSFAAFASRSARGDLLVTTAEKALSSGSLPATLRTQVNTALATGYLGVDRVEEAITLLLDSISQPARGDERMYESYSTASTVLQLGVLLKRDDLIEKGLATLSGIRDPYLTSYTTDTVAEFLLHLGRYAEAEERYIQQLEFALGSEEARYGGADVEAPLSGLAKVYSLAGRHEDVLFLLENVPHWPFSDLSEAVDSTNVDLLVAAAKALDATGRANDALAIAEQLLHVAPGNDRVYELYVLLAGDKAIAGLDNVFSLDEYEERPLIWKAKVLLDRGQYAEAEAVARQAIAIDPSDGEQGKGDRMRVYAILSEVLAKRGDPQQSRVYANAVRAIRMSENADDFYAVGLTKRAIAMYEEALIVFEDAYCIQSRLAIQLLESGDPDGAAVHFRKAFELMPDSFGRIESHCFGCEGIFESQQAQDIALNVLQQLLRDRPDKPQIPYLMGYLHKSRKQIREAIPYFEKAVELDPKYLNAWIELAGAYSATNAAAAVAEKAAFAIASLDPLGRHTPYYLSEQRVADFAELWRVGNERYLKTPRLSESLFELSASKAKRDADPLDPYASMQEMYGPSRTRGPASLILSNSLVRLVYNMISGESYWDYGIGSIGG